MAGLSHALSRPAVVELVDLEAREKDGRESIMHVLVVSPSGNRSSSKLASILQRGRGMSIRLIDPCCSLYCVCHTVNKPILDAPLRSM